MLSIRSWHVAIPVLALCWTARPARAQEVPPSTDIYLAPLSIVNGRAVIGAPVNVTNRAGYDNQPSFTPDGRSILFTSVRDDGQADTYRYDIASRTTTRVTNTPESEYSPTVMPGGKRFSVVRVEADSTQRLWSFAMDGSDPRLVLQTVKPVGYHLWLDDQRLALFLLGNPDALVVVNRATGAQDTVARDIGRALIMNPGSRAFSFLQHISGRSWSLQRVDLGAGRPSTAAPIVTMPAGADYVVWLSPRLALTAAGSALMTWSQADSDWKVARDLAGAGLRNASRLAVSPNGKWLAIVAEPGGA